ncbi:uncharacterized protein PFLUO_LOCUS9212 [Penicillium psychrofluorescens]|uniref:uncharacterized protein n=1 Tax=Penicillium psychrofluorescens TaxID=3158075 RepID=UPI003CCD29F6
MDNANIDGPIQRPDIADAMNGASASTEKTGNFSNSINGPVHVNGASIDRSNRQSKAPAGQMAGLTPAEPFEIPHITQGFFSFGILVNRATQQCWNDLSELITELAAVQVPPQEFSTSLATTNGKSPGNQSSDNLHKKLRVLDFAHAKRAEFIKLLVLSQWSRQAVDVSRLIDLQGFIRTRHQAYAAAVQYVGEMKRDLVRAQVANPDLKTALEVLSKGQVKSLPDLGYKPPKPLTARVTLKKLQKINRIISIRLALHDEVPIPLRNYRVHDGRVTFTVFGEYELDLSVAEESKSSQFFFVDIRFLFSPSSPIPKGRIFNELDAKINDVLRDDGLIGCFEILHGLVLTNKVSILFRQAKDLARGLWSDILRIELLHRTLVVQYWSLKPGPKSWIELGVRRGHRSNDVNRRDCRISHIGLRWMRDGQQANSDDIQFDLELLSMERILRGVIAQHTAHLLSTAYATLRKNLLFSNHFLTLRAQLSQSEPGDCHLDVQLTTSRHLRVSMEPMSGAITFSGTPNVMERLETDRSPNRSSADEIVSRISRLRCVAAVEEIEAGTKALGLETVSQRGLGVDPRRVFPSNILRSTFFTHHLWDRRWVAAATSSMDGDHWWLVQVRPGRTVKTAPPSGTVGHNASSLESVHRVSNTLVSEGRLDYAALADLVHALTGMLSIYANARCLANLPGMDFHPSLENLHLGTQFEVPDLFFRYNVSQLPSAFRIALPAGLERKSYVQDTVRLAFHGTDRHNRAVLLVAYGTLRGRIKAIVPLISKMDPSIITQDNGGGFALRLLVPAGHSVIAGLLERLQRLECVLSILQPLIQRGMEPRSLSLSRIAFAYGPAGKLNARFDINVSGPSLSKQIDVTEALSKAQSLFHLRLGIHFDGPSPHRRIQESLTVSLNHDFAKTGVVPILKLMSVTLPLLNALDQITSTGQPGSPVVHVIVRSPSTFQIRYPRLKARFQLFPHLNRGRLKWGLRDANRSKPADDNPVASMIREKIYNSKGDGWNGLGDGAVADMGKVGVLLVELNNVVRQLELSGASLEEGAKDQSSIAHQNAKEQHPTKDSVGARAPGKAPGAHANQDPKLNVGGMGSADIITID